MNNLTNPPGTWQGDIPIGSHKEAAVQFLKLVEAGHIEDAYRKYAAPNGSHHNPYFRSGFPALQKGMQENHDQSPNMRLTVKNVIGDGDLVAIHSHIVQRPGDAGTAAVHIFRFLSDKIAEFWDVGEPVPPDSPNKDGMF